MPPVVAAAFLVVTVVAAGACTTGPAGEADASSTTSRGGAARPDPSSRPAPSLRASLTAQVQLRAHLLRVLAERHGAGDDEAVEALVSALAERRGVIGSLLDGAGPVGRPSPLERALAAEDELVVDHIRAGDVLAWLQVRARRPEVERRLSLAVAEVSGDRLPVDVAQPLVGAHLGALLELVDAGEQVGGATAASFEATDRLVDALVLGVAAELDLAGDPAGDAAALRTELVSVLVQDGFARASGALGAPSARGQAAASARRLAAVMERFHGEEVGAAVQAAWVDQRAAVGAWLDAVGERDRGRRAGRVVPAADGRVGRARQVADQATDAVASLLADTAGDPAVASVARRTLDDGGAALAELRRGDADWQAGAEAALGLTELADTLASATTRQKSLG